MALNTEKIAGLVRELLIEIGEDPAREGLLDTPKRVAKAFEFLTSGYHTDTKQLINGACFTQETSSMVIVKDIDSTACANTICCRSLAAATSATFPAAPIRREQLARLVDMYARRLQLQERLTEQDFQSGDGIGQRQGRGRDHRSAPPVHDDARRGEAEFDDGDFVRPRRVFAIRLRRGRNFSPSRASLLKHARTYFSERS